MKENTSMKKSLTMREKPKLIVIAGPKGSGKTSVTTQILEYDY